MPVIAQRAVVFECITTSHRLVTSWYARKNCPIYYLQSRLGESTPAWFRRLESAGRLRPLSLKDPLYLRLNPAGDMALEMTEDLYEREFRRNALIGHMARLFGDERVELAFKKYLNTLLEHHFHYRLLGDRLRGTLTDAETVWFIPARVAGGHLPYVTGDNLPPWGLPFLRGRSIAGTVPPLPMRIPWWAQCRSRFLEVWNNLKACGETIVFALWKCLVSSVTRPGVSNYPFAVAIIAPAREFASDIRGCDMLLDGAGIRSDNTLFVPVARISRGQRARLIEKGLDIADYPAGPSRPVLGKVLRYGALVLGQVLRSPWWVVRVSAYLVRDYWIWNSFVERYRIGHFISYNDYSFRHIGRNLVLKHHRVRTWYYLDTLNTTHTFVVDADEPYRQAIWSYLFYDECVSWNEEFSRFLRRHRQVVTTYSNVGCLWSEHVRLLKQGRMSSPLRDRCAAAGWSSAYEIVAVFDTSYADESITTYRDGVAFARDVGRLLAAFPRMFVIWKEKKARRMLRELGQDACELARIYDALSRHPRCHFTGHTTSPAELLALCDLAIAFPFTSPVIEAVGAGVKGLYYDPLEKCRARYEMWIPKLVVHGFDDLRQRVDDLLYRTTREEYERYLDSYVRGPIDPYLDGMGLSRLRALICDGEGAPEHGDAVGGRDGRVRFAGGCGG